MAKKKNRKKGKKQPSLYDLALKMMETAFKPAMREAVKGVREASKHNTAGGTLDQSFDRGNQAIAGAQKAATDQATAAAGRTRDAAAMGVDGAQQLGADQAAYATEQANLYGQTADAAKVATERAGAQASSLAGAGANAAGFLEALGVIQGNLGVSQTAANEARRGEAHTDMRREIATRQGGVNDLRAERAAGARDLALDLGKEQREYELALKTLGFKDRDSRRDFIATIRGLNAQERMNDADNATSTGNNRATNLAKYDMDGDGDIDQRDRKLAKRYGLGKTNSSGGKKGMVKIKVGPKGSTIKVTQSVAREHAEGSAKWQKYYDAVARAMNSGKYDNPADARKASGSRTYTDQTLWDAAWTARANQGKDDGQRIPKTYVAALRALFPGGKLPPNIARAIER